MLRLFRNPDFQCAIKDMLGPSFGIITWSIVSNIAILKTGVGVFNTFVMTMTTYASSAQLASIPLMLGNYPIEIIFFTTLIVNSRFIVFSASIAPHFRSQSLLKRSILSYLNADISFAVFIKKYPLAKEGISDPKVYHYYLGTTFINWIVWQIGMIIALIFGSQIPDSWGLAFAGTLVLICLVVPLIKTQKEFSIALVCIFIAIVTINFPYRLGILCTVITAMTLAYLIHLIPKKND